MILDEFKALIEEFEKKDEYANIKAAINNHDDKYREIANTKFGISKKAILGIDIYQYSQYESDKQILVPLVFDLILEETKRWIRDSEKVIFANYDFSQPYIDTGDGGFFIFNDPFQAVIFCINFYVLTKTFNTGHYYPSLRNFIGEITIRTCITYDDVYKYKNNMYGAAIINNARILSKDKINRFIIDEATNNWYNLNIGGLDNIKNYTLRDYNKEEIEKLIPGQLIPQLSSFVIVDHKNKQLKYDVFQNTHIQKIGTIQIKKNLISVYNVEMQVIMSINDETDPAKSILLTTTIGNSNSTGFID
jgi:hypothetical protein